MNWLDIVLLIVVLASIGSGLSSGFARIGVGLIATVLALLLGSWFYADAGAMVLPYVASKTVANLIGFFIVFGGVMILGSIVGRVLAAVFKWIGLGWFDRFMGGVFGLLRAVVIGVFIVLVLVAFSPVSPPKSIVESTAAPFLVEAADVVSSIAPKEMRDSFRDGLEKVRKAWVDPVEHAVKKMPSREI